MIYKRFCYRYEFSKFHEMDSKPGKRVLNISLKTTITCFRDYHNVTFTFPGDDHNVFLYIIESRYRCYFCTFESESSSRIVQHEIKEHSPEH